MRVVERDYSLRANCVFGIAASQPVISIELSLTEDSEQEAKIPCSESGPREVQEMPNGGVSSVAFSNRQVLNRLGLQSATTNVMMVAKGTNRLQIGCKKQQIGCKWQQICCK